MMISIYYRKDDEWLLEKVDEICARERRSRSAVILSLLEEYLERDRKIGEILKDMGLLSLKELQEAIELQKKHKNEKKLVDSPLRPLLILCSLASLCSSLQP